MRELLKTRDLLVSREKRELLDAIDAAYEEREQQARPVYALTCPPLDKCRLVAKLRDTRGAFVLPASCDIKMLPVDPAPLPFELSRWADDGGRV